MTSVSKRLIKEKLETALHASLTEFGENSLSRKTKKKINALSKEVAVQVRHDLKKSARKAEKLARKAEAASKKAAAKATKSLNGKAKALATA